MPSRRAIGNEFENRFRFPKFPTNKVIEGEEVLELGGACVHEGNLEALTYERQVLPLKNTIFLCMTR